MSDRRFNDRQRAALYLASEGHCEQCGAELSSGWHADHVKPWSRGGPTDVINGQALCPKCNLKKGSHMKTKKPLRKWQREALDLYDQHQDRVFLVDSFPGTGKTRFISEVVEREHHKGKADATIAIVPSAELRKQMADDFHEETGIQLDPKWNGTSQLVRGGFRGAVVTYQWLSKNSMLLRKHVARQATLVVLDEPHHADDDGQAWGTALREALEPASKLLLTTGTPFRTNGNPIPFVKYDEEGRVIANYSYNYGKALADGVVRAIFFNHHKGEMEWDDEDGVVKATFEEKLDRKGESRRLRTALMWNGEHIGSLLRNGIDKLRELREDDQDAALLIIAMDQEHAKNLAKRMRQEHGINPVIAISEDGDAAANAIASFKNNQDPCIIAVNMISEGVNIPRIRIIVYATNIVTDLYFLQAIGRATRVEENHDDHTSWVFIPGDARLHAHAEKIAQAREDALNKLEKDQKRDKQNGKANDEQNPLWFQPRSATFSEASATVNGIHLDPAELIIAEKLKSSKPSWAGIAKEQIAAVLKGIGYDFTAQRAGVPDPPTQEPTKTDQPLWRDIEKLRRLNNSTIIGRLHYATGMEYPTIQNRLNASVGIATVKTCTDPYKLQRRYNIAKRWLKESITPEVPFHD